MAPGAINIPAPKQTHTATFFGNLFPHVKPIKLAHSGRFPCAYRGGRKPATTGTMRNMANTTSTPNLSTVDNTVLFAILRDLDKTTRRRNAARVITELRDRNLSLNEIARETSIARATIQDWATLPTTTEDRS